jgi:hypothetical protein
MSLLHFVYQWKLSQGDMAFKWRIRCITCHRRQILFPMHSATNADSHRERFESVNGEGSTIGRGIRRGRGCVSRRSAGNQMADGHHRVISVANTCSRWILARICGNRVPGWAEVHFPGLASSSSYVSRRR